MAGVPNFHDVSGESEWFFPRIACTTSSFRVLLACSSSSSRECGVVTSDVDMVSSKHEVILMAN